jgi:hypothetical protein
VLDYWLSPMIEAGMAALAVFLFLILSAACEIGFRVGRWRRGDSALSEAENSAVSILTGGMLALLAFILGLTVSFAQNRYEARRDLVAVEANAIGTAALRAQLVGGAEGEAIALLIGDYARTRLAFTRAEFHVALAPMLARAADDQRRIWSLATVIARRDPTPITASLISALNTMFDAALSQRFAFAGNTPPGVLTLLVAGSILAIGAMGFELGLARHRQPVLSSLLILMWVGGMVLTVDLSRPRFGAVRVETAPLEWTIQEMTPQPATNP